MKIVGLCVCSGGEADRWLELTLKEFKRLCDDAVICLNNPTKKEVDLVNKYGYWHYEDNREWGKDQPRIKADLLKKIGKLKPDFVLPLDADEVYDPLFTRVELEKVATNLAGGYFYIVNLWDDEQHCMRHLGFWNIRLFRYLPDYTEYLNKPVHCGLAPPIFYKYGTYLPWTVVHRGLMKPEDREKKIQRYEKYDPKAKYKGRAYYESLKQDKGFSSFDLNKTREEVKNEVARYDQRSYNTIKKLL